MPRFAEGNPIQYADLPSGVRTHYIKAAVNNGVGTAAFENGEFHGVGLDALNDRVGMTIIVPASATSVEAARLYASAAANSTMTLTVRTRALAVDESVGGAQGQTDSMTFTPTDHANSHDQEVINVLTAFDGLTAIGAQEIIGVEVEITTFTDGLYAVFGIEVVFA